MPITVNWNASTRDYIESRFQDPWTIDEFLEARKAWHRMIKSVDHHVPIMLDLSESVEAPPGVLRHFCAIHRTPHPRQGHVYIAGLNPLYERLAPHLFDGVIDPNKSLRLVDSTRDILAPA